MRWVIFWRRSGIWLDAKDEDVCSSSVQAVIFSLIWLKDQPFQRVHLYYIFGLSINPCSIVLTRFSGTKCTNLRHHILIVFDVAMPAAGVARARTSIASSPNFTPYAGKGFQPLIKVVHLFASS